MTNIRDLNFDQGAFMRTNNDLFRSISASNQIWSYQFTHIIKSRSVILSNLREIGEACIPDSHPLFCATSIQKSSILVHLQIWIAARGGLSCWSICFETCVRNRIPFTGRCEDGRSICSSKATIFVVGDTDLQSTWKSNTIRKCVLSCERPIR